jgi:hypothetical protein
MEGDYEQWERRIEVNTVKAKEVVIEDISIKQEYVEIDINEIGVSKPDFTKYQYLYLFVNPISGSQEGRFIFDIFKEKGEVFSKYGYTMDIPPLNPKNKEIKIHLFNITLLSSYELGINTLKEHLEFYIKLEIYTHGRDISITNPMVLIGGGDGTVLSIIENLAKNGIDEKKCTFGHMPLGTGNDLANSLGFGSKKLYKS